jgi:hypothetical protein
MRYETCRSAVSGDSQLEPQAKSVNPKWIDANPFGLLVI